MWGTLGAAFELYTISVSLGLLHSIFVLFFIFVIGIITATPFALRIIRADPFVIRVIMRCSVRV